MSIDINNYIGFGYKVSLEDSPYANFNYDDNSYEKYDNWYDALCDCEYAHRIDHYDGDLFFFGITSNSVVPGDISDLTSLLIAITKKDNNNMTKVKKEFHRFFPNLKDRQPDLYLVSEFY